MTATTASPTVPGLHATAAEELPFARDHLTRAYLLERPAGNLLIYGNGLLSGQAGELEARGGVTRHYLTHWHETLFGDPHVGAEVHVHAEDAAEARSRARVDATFDRAHRLGDDFEAIPIPGHTPGSTAYLWEAGDHRLLFTGDSLYVRRGEWVAAVLDSSDRDAYVASLEAIRELEFDALVPWAAGVGDETIAFVTPSQRRELLDEVLERVRAGADE